MGYYRAGGYYAAGGYYRAGGIFGFLKGAVKTVAGVVGKAGIPVVSGVANIVAGTPSPITPNYGFAANLPQVPQRPEPGIAGAVHRMVPGGATGYLPRRRMNVANVKAARRAIRRITGVRHLLKSIEKQLPMRPAPRRYGSPGVITRSEAARALRH